MSYVSLGEPCPGNDPIQGRCNVIRLPGVLRYCLVCGFDLGIIPGQTPAPQPAIPVTQAPQTNTPTPTSTPTPRVVNLLEEKYSVELGGKRKSVTKLQLLQLIASGLVNEDSIFYLAGMSVKGSSLVVVKDLFNSQLDIEQLIQLAKTQAQTQGQAVMPTPAPAGSAGLCPQCNTPLKSQNQIRCGQCGYIL